MAGSRTLTSTAETNIAVDSTTAYNLVKFEWGGATGTKWYSDTVRTPTGAITTEGRVTDWGSCRCALNGRGQWTFSLSDDDGALRGYVDAEGTGGKTVTLYSVVGTMAEADWIVVFKGVTEDRMDWNERNAKLRVTVLDYAAVLSSPLGTLVDEGDFPYAAPDAYGKTLPVVYGYKRGVQAYCVEGGGPRTVMTTDCGRAETTFRVEDATQFPAGTIRVWVYDELMEGSFTKNRFKASRRNLTFATGTAEHDTYYDWYHDKWRYRSDVFVLSGAGGKPSGYWIGKSLRANVGGAVQYRRIIRHINDADGDRVWIDYAFSDGPPYDLDDVLGVAFGYTPYVASDGSLGTVHITTTRRRHERGEEVRYAGGTSSLGEVVYVASDAEATSMQRVFCVIGDEKKCARRVLHRQPARHALQRDPGAELRDRGVHHAAGVHRAELRALADHDHGSSDRQPDRRAVARQN